jgi:4-aminobutyrate aminotransferase
MAANLPLLITSLPGPRAQTVIARDHAVLSPSYTRPYPFVMARGEGAIVEDVDGNRFLDCNAGIAVAATGHAHPNVVKAVQDQAAKFLHMSGTDFYYENMVALAEKLASIAPGGGARRVYFGNSGTEAIEAAMKMARYHTGRQQFISFFGSFHGRTMGALSLTGSKDVQKRGFFPLVPGVHHVPYPNCYRCPYGTTPDQCSVDCVRHIEEVVMRHIAPPGEIAAIFVEPVQGEGGYIVPPQKFMDELQSLASRHKILLVFDEIQSGMGRTGKMFAAEHFHATPDILALAKGIASGLPLSATVARAEIMNWTPGSHASTFGGNPVSIAASLATVELLEEELIDNAARIGDYIKNRLRHWPNRFPIVGDVRGLGLMIGFELVYDQQTKQRAPELRDRLELLAFHRGLLILGCGQNTIRLCPPLVITKDQADWAVDTLEECLTILVRDRAFSTSAAE